MPLPEGSPFKRPPMTTAHIAAHRFYRKALKPRPDPSVVERIHRAPSPFAVAGLVDDFRRFTARTASPKTRARVAEAARVRVAVLRGRLP